MSDRGDDRRASSYESVAPRLKEILRPGGEPSRREAMQWLGTLGIAGVTASSFVGTATRALAATPKRGGKLTVALEQISPTDTFDPARLTSSSDYIRGFSYFNGLTRVDGNAQPIPELAESFEVDGTADKWVFKLRKGVEFHDGKTLDAEDVVFSLLRHKDEEVGSAAKALAKQIKDVKADGKDRVRITLEGPNADFPVVLSSFQFVIAQAGTTDFSKAIGTGPLRLKEFSPGVRTVGVRNDNYFKEGAPYIDEQEVIGISDSPARISALLSGDVDMIQSLDPTAKEQVAATDSAEVFQTPASHIMQLIMMVDRPPTDNKDLRRALQYMMDRQRFIDTILKGGGQLGNDHTIPPSHPLYNSELPQREADIDKAKFHLKKAGMAGGKLEVHVSGAAERSVEIGLIMQQQAAQAGFTIDLKREPSDGYWSNIWGKRAAHGGEWFPRPTPDMLLSLGWVSGAAWNDTGIANPRLDELIDQGRSAVDPAKRKEIYWEIQQIVYEDGGNMIPAFKDFVDAISSRVKGLSPVPVAGLGGYYFADTVWLDG